MWTVSTGDSSLTQRRASWRRTARVMSAFSLAIRRSSLLRAISASPSQNRSRRERAERASGSRLVILVARTWREWLNSSSTVSAGRCCRQWNAVNSCVSGRWSPNASRSNPRTSPAMALAAGACASTSRRAWPSRCFRRSSTASWPSRS